MISKFIIILITTYQRYYSRYRPPVCRFEPTCSNFALGAFSKFRFFVALKMSLWRLLRCGPWTSGGCDPVP